MYSKYANYRFPSKVRLPENYSGNAFSSREENAPKKETEPQTEAETIINQEEIPTKTESEAHEEKEVSLLSRSDKKLKLPFINFNVGKLFSGGLGFEELLIIALILLLSEGDNDDGMILVLLLLLFIG